MGLEIPSLFTSLVVLCLSFFFTAIYHIYLFNFLNETSEKFNLNKPGDGANVTKLSLPLLTKENL